MPGGVALSASRFLSLSLFRFHREIGSRSELERIDERHALAVFMLVFLGHREKQYQLAAISDGSGR